MGGAGQAPFSWALRQGRVPGPSAHPPPCPRGGSRWLAGAPLQKCLCPASAPPTCLPPPVRVLRSMSPSNAIVPPWPLPGVHKPRTAAAEIGQPRAPALGVCGSSLALPTPSRTPHPSAMESAVQHPLRVGDGVPQEPRALPVPPPTTSPGAGWGQQQPGLGAPVLDAAHAEGRLRTHTAQKDF